jgi:hypothetical protein
MKSSRDIIQLSRRVDITMRPSVQRLIERNVKCHVTFFRLIKFKISIWVCNNIKNTIQICRSNGTNGIMTNLSLGCNPSYHSLTRLITVYYWICYPPGICMKYSTLGVKQQSINRSTHGSTAWSGLTTIMDHWIQHCPRPWIILSSCKYQRFYISTFFLNFWLAYYLLFYTAVTKDMHYCVYDTSHMT